MDGILALSVRPGSKVFIGDGYYEVLDSSRERVRIAHKFPDEVVIEREKVRERRLSVERAARSVH